MRLHIKNTKDFIELLLLDILFEKHEYYYWRNHLNFVYGATVETGRSIGNQNQIYSINGPRTLNLENEERRAMTEEQ